MDALSKTFYTKEASYQGATFTCIFVLFFAIISFDHAAILHLHVHIRACGLSYHFLTEFLQEVMYVNSPREPLQDQFSFK
jgi:hypothetical protein